jgi:hypothetical protein
MTPITIGSTALTFVQNYSANSIASGNSNVVVLTNSSVLISSAGSANVLKVDSGLVTIAGNLIPASNVTYSLGNNTNRFSNLWLSNTTIYLGNVVIGATANTLTVDGANIVVATANSDIQATGNISATGNITGNYFLGNVFFANGITASKIYSGNSEVNVVSSGGNVNVTVGGTSNIAVFSIDGEYVTGLLSVSGNITGSNVLTGGIVSATGNVTGGNINTAGLASITGNVISGNVTTGGLISATGNATAGNILTAGIVSATGNVTGDYFLGNVFYANGITASKIYSGTSEVNVVSSGGNVNVSVGGTSNVAVFTTEGEYVTGFVSASGNTTSGNVLTGGLVSAGGNITGANILTGGLVSATGNATAGNVNTAGQVSATANITGGNLLTSGLISATGSVYTGNIYTSGGISLTGNTITSSGATLTIDPNGSGAVDGNVVIAGNLSVQGNVTYIDSNVITTNEKSITLANNVNTGSLADGAGIDVGNNDLAYWRFNNATTSWQSNIGLTPAANATLNLGGTSNYWANLYAGNTIIAGSEAVTGNITGGNVLTGGLISATGNVTGNYINGNGSALTGISTFSNITVTGGSYIAANTISTLLTLIAGNNIVLTANNASKSLQIDYSSSGGTSIFSTGGDMGTVVDPVTSSEDLGDVITASTTAYDLGQLGVDGVVSNSDIIGNTITGDKLNSSTYISITGNLTAANLAMTSSAVDVRGWWHGSGNSFSVNSQETAPTDVILNTAGIPGSNMYVVGTANQTIYQYSLSTAWQVNSASYTSLSANVAAQDTSPQGIRFDDSNTALYMLGGTNKTIYQYTVNYANIATLSYATKSFSVNSEETAPKGFTFSNDGAVLYVVGTTSDSIFQYTLSIPGDISTAVYNVPGSFSISAQDTSPVGIEFSTDGQICYVVGSTNDYIYQYSLATAWDITTASYSGYKFSVFAQEGAVTGLYRNQTAQMAYAVGAYTGTATVWQYNTGYGTIATSNSLYIGGQVQAVGNIQTQGYLFGNASLLTGVVAATIANTTSNITAGTAAGNITVGIGGTSNVVIFASTGEYVTGVVSATGNISGNYFVGNGAALTGITSTPPPLNIILQQSFGGF